MAVAGRELAAAVVAVRNPMAAVVAAHLLVAVAVWVGQRAEVLLRGMASVQPQFMQRWMRMM